jgi:hypothetical protein
VNLTPEEKAGAIIGVIQLQISKFAETVKQNAKINESIYIEDVDSTILVYCATRLYNFLKPFLEKGYDGSDYSRYDRVISATVHGKAQLVGVVNDGPTNILNSQWSYHITQEVYVSTRHINSLEQWFLDETYSS